MQREQKAELRAWYTVPDLARMAGTHRNDMRATLQKAGVPIDDSRRAGRVLLVDLRRCAPELWESIQLVVQYREAGRSSAA